MSEKIKWGVLGAAGIAYKKAIPGIVASPNSELFALASRSEDRIRPFKREFSFEKAYTGYDEMLADPEIDAVYIPLPNHLHFEWIKKCVEAGKHVLCEKPLVLNEKEVEELIHLRDTSGKLIGEAFMVRSHPLWGELRSHLSSGRLGKLQMIQGAFTYFNDDPQNIRNAYPEGGGGMWDIGCYLIQLSRHLFGTEPTEISARLKMDEKFDVDIMASAWMTFPEGQVAFQVGTKLFRSQFLRLYTDKCWIDIPMPFNPSEDKESKYIVYFDQDPDSKKEVFSQPHEDQFALQFDNFSKAIMGKEPLNIDLEDTLYNTKALMAAFQSDSENRSIQLK